MKGKITADFRSCFSAEPERIVRAPGRANLLGGHTDYNDGFVLPLALDRAAWIAARAVEVPEARLHALDLGKFASFSLRSLSPAEGTWADYPRGVAWAFQERGLEPVGLEAVLSSRVPVGSGLSSSAAIELAFACVWQELSGGDMSRRELALLCQKAENDYVGVPCGALDQLSSALGVRDHALLIDCRSLETTPVPLPENVAIVVADSKVRRQLASSEYHVRRAQCEEAVEILSGDLPGIASLRDVSLDALVRLRHHLPDVLYRRAHHVVSDCARVLEAAEALQEEELETVGALMNQCHVSLRDDYEVSSPELDALVEAAWEVEGCYGSRLTGAGFGGCTVSLVATDAVSGFEAHVSAAYEAAFDRRPNIYACRSADGVAVVSAGAGA